VLNIEVRHRVVFTAQVSQLPVVFCEICLTVAVGLLCESRHQDRLTHLLESFFTEGRVIDDTAVYQLEHRSDGLEVCLPGQLAAVARLHDHRVYQRLVEV